MKELLKDLIIIRNEDYINFKSLFLVHTNGIEGSTFTFAQMTTFLTSGIVEGTHSFDDIVESANSSLLFDFVLKTIDEPITKYFLKEMNSILLKGTRFDEAGFSGKFKTIANAISGSDVALSQPWEVEEDLERLLQNKIDSSVDIAKFHVDFEKIHPFVDGNGRIGRMLILKQCLTNNITPPLITKESSIEYKNILETCQINGDYVPIINYFKVAQDEMLVNNYFKNILDVHESMLLYDNDYAKKYKNSYKKDLVK